MKYKDREQLMDEIIDYDECVDYTEEYKSLLLTLSNEDLKEMINIKNKLEKLNKEFHNIWQKNSKVKYD